MKKRLKLTDIKLLNLQSPCRFTMIFAVPFLVIMGILLLALIAFEKSNHETRQVTELLESGRSFFSQLILAREWNSKHDGVYVKVTDQTQPNPYLVIPQRDITSTTGNKYTMINPAYMTRQMSEMAEDMGQFQYHITSLKLLNPINKPDQWEKKALAEFELGASESYTFTDIAGERFFRYMAPLHIGESCLNCHHEQGYTIGDVRGGISINIPATLSDKNHDSAFRRTVTSYVIIGFAAFLFITTIIWSFSKTVIKSIQSEVERNRLKASIELAGAAAHELRQPLTVLMGITELIKSKGKEMKLSSEDAEIILEQCSRMDDIIVRMLNITQYKTREYTEGVKIFDLNSVENPEE